MNVDVLDFELRQSKTRIGCVLVKYHELVMYCELVYHVKTKKAWIRMPEHWFTKDKKTSYCSWPSKETSDEFQKEVLNKIFDKYDLDFDKIAELHRTACEKRSASRNV